MDNERYRGMLISDFNITNFSRCLNSDEEFPRVEATVAPFGQVMQVLMQRDLECWKQEYDLAVVWTRPESVVESFNHVLMYENVSIEEVLGEVDEYAASLLNIRDRVRFIFVPSWVFPLYHRGFGMLDMKTGMGVANTLMRMNLRLSENFDKAPNIYLLNTQKWIERLGKNAFNPKLWYMGKIAFGNEVFIEAVKDVKAALTGVIGNSKKLIILDLDDTLWGGVAGEVGWKNIKLGGHDHIGEAYVDFQRALKSLMNRGILLGVVSKNDETIALETIKNHPEMVLRLDDFVGWRINWQDKAQNIVDLVSELNLGLQSVVFIDDSPFERMRVREALPDVFVPEWPQDSMLYKSVLLSLRCFDVSSVTKEDVERTKMYLTERQRRTLKSKVGALDEWLKSLGIRVKVEELNETNLSRMAQLLNKTNQMNLTTRRMTKTELMEWAQQKDCKLWAFRVFDKFGDYGLTGIISLEAKNGIARIVDFVLSCRVMGRKVEETMLYTVIKYVQSLGLKEIRAEYVPTPKNKPCLEFWKKSGFNCSRKGHLFSWQTNKDYFLPDAIQVEGAF